MTNEEKLRKLLWLNHGCPLMVLYGDDGEMQCPECRIDFKRDDPDKIEKVWVDRNLKVIMDLYAIEKGTT